MHGCNCLSGSMASCTSLRYHAVLHISQRFHSVLRTSLRYYAVLRTQPNSCNSVFCRLREAELLFQADRVADSDRLLRTVVRKNPTYAGALHRAHHLLDIIVCLYILSFILSCIFLLAQKFTHSLTHPPTHPLTHPLTHSLSHHSLVAPHTAHLALTC